jgi:pyridoxamine 5'-phosphate oxidase
MNPRVALNFYWPQMARQVRIRGQIKKVDEAQSDLYFSSRPIKSQFSAIISPQSQELSNRISLDRALNELIQSHGDKPIERPSYWGGYIINPQEYEFWQGRDNRLHDRIQYFRQANQWKYRRLAP